MAVEIEHPLRGTTPNEAIGKTMHQAIVRREHQWRIDRMRSRDRANIRRGVLRRQTFVVHVTPYATPRQTKKDAASAVLEVGVALGKLNSRSSY